MRMNGEGVNSINHSDFLSNDYAQFLFKDGPLADIKLKVRKSNGMFDSMRSHCTSDLFNKYVPTNFCNFV